MPICIITAAKEKIEWNENEDKPALPQMLVSLHGGMADGYVKKLSASGEALLFISDRFTVPRCYDKEANGSHILKPVITWSGDIAQFIYDNLD